MSEDPLDVLCCPECKGIFRNDGDSAATDLESAHTPPGRDTQLVCTACGKTYPVIQGIPRFVSSDAYTNNFSFEWKIHRKTQIDGKRKDSSRNFYLRFGLPPEFFKGKRVLDVGVGPGRYADVALKAGAKLYGVDLSLAIDVARENLADYPNVFLSQADVFDLPFQPETFDVIFSFGVLHHTPDPKKAFVGLLKYLKPGGVICVTLYENRGMYRTSRFLRKITTRLPNPCLYALTTTATVLLYVPYRFLGLRYGILGRFMPISLSGSISEAILDTFDCYSPKYQFTFADHEVFAWFKESSLKDMDVRPQPVTVLGYK